MYSARRDGLISKPRMSERTHVDVGWRLEEPPRQKSNPQDLTSTVSTSATELFLVQSSLCARPSTTVLFFYLSLLLCPSDTDIQSPASFTSKKPATYHFSISVLQRYPPQKDVEPNKGKEQKHISPIMQAPVVVMSKYFLKYKTPTLEGEPLGPLPKERGELPKKRNI